MDPSVTVPWDIYDTEDEGGVPQRRLLYRKGDRIPAKAAAEAGLLPIESSAETPVLEHKSTW